MTKETSLWKTFRACMQWQHICRIENLCGEGTPDVNGCHRGIEFWVELKVAKQPKRIGTNVAVRHFTKAQRQWLRDRWEAGGRAYLLLQIEDLYFLFRGNVAAVVVGYVPIYELHNYAIIVAKHLGQLAEVIVDENRS